VLRVSLCRLTDWFLTGREYNLIAVRNCKVAVAGYLYMWTSVSVLLDCALWRWAHSRLLYQSLIISPRSVQLYQILTHTATVLMQSHVCTLLLFLWNRSVFSEKNHVVLVNGLYACYESVDCSMATGMEYWNGLNCYKMLSRK